MLSVSALPDSYNSGYKPSRVVLYVGCIGMDVALVSVDFYQLEMIENTAGLSAPGSTGA
jgi:hypothetical protein